MKNTILLSGAVASLLITAMTACNQPTLSPDTQILANQIGFYPNQEKVIFLDTALNASFSVFDQNGKIVLKGQTGQSKLSNSNRFRTPVDISELKVAGDYTLKIGGLDYKFSVKDDLLKDLAVASLKAFYYQRTGVAIDEPYAKEWSRPAGHLDDKVMIHPSAVSKGRKAGDIISSQFGWYDAGDYNKYIVNSAYTIGMILSTYEIIPDYFANQNVDIPESSNNIPDVLDEMMFNMKWMLTMQDPADGGVYHKLTTPSFEAFVMPSECKQQRYVVAKSSPASYDFAALMAMASRIYSNEELYGDFSKKALDAAKKAYAWAESNKGTFYFQFKMNEKFDPDVTTGAYDDINESDERFWAATELYLASGDENYRSDAVAIIPNCYKTSTWGNLASLGQWQWIRNAATGNEADKEIGEAQTKLLQQYADSLVDVALTTPFATPYGGSPMNFHWGCLSESCANPAIELSRLFYLTKEQKYLTAAIENMDYILGRNPLGFCYVTGFGVNSTKHPHHRLSEADGIEKPIPGFLAGGPNGGKQDGLDYKTDDPELCFLDDVNSYASNEIAINWNASLVSLTALIDYFSQSQ